MERVGKLKTKRYAQILDWNPHSSLQVMAYLRHMGYAIPKDRNTKKETTSEDALLDILQANPQDGVLKEIITARKLQKAIGYLYDTILGEDGRMHPKYTFLPDTGRLSAQNPNIMNQPQGHASARSVTADIEKALAEAIRRTVVPSPGCTLIELDWKAIEAVLVGFFANDPDYIRISLLDIHSYLAAFKIGKPADLAWNDEELGAYLNKIKKAYPDERFFCKTGNHADGYDIGVAHLAEVLGSRQAARDFKLLRRTAFPKVAEWQVQTRWRAHSEGRLTNPFGYLRYFWNIYERKKDGTPKLGKEAWEALAFLPQSTGAAMLRATMLRVRSHADYGSYFWILAPIHDSLLVECLEGKEKATIDIIAAEMTRPWPELNGLSMLVETKSGPNWGEMKVI